MAPGILIASVCTVHCDPNCLSRWSRTRESVTAGCGEFHSKIQNTLKIELKMENMEISKVSSDFIFSPKPLRALSISNGY
jgi:hypothetical protein